LKAVLERSPEAAGLALGFGLAAGLAVEARRVEAAGLFPVIFGIPHSFE
jgi:hypothetical protein